MVEAFQRYAFKEESFQFKDEYENLVSIPRHRGQKIRSRRVPGAENVPPPALLQALQLGGARTGASSLFPVSGLGTGPRTCVFLSRQHSTAAVGPQADGVADVQGGRWTGSS